MREQSWFRGSGPYLLGFFISLLSAIKRSSSKIKKKTTSVGFDLSTQTLDTRPESAPPRLSAPPPLTAAGAHWGQPLPARRRAGCQLSTEGLLLKLYASQGTAPFHRGLGASKTKTAETWGFCPALPLDSSSLRSERTCGADSALHRRRELGQGHRARQ